MTPQQKHKGITEILAKGLHFYEKQPFLDLDACSSEDIINVINGSIKRYSSDNHFKLKVDSICSQILLFLKECDNDTTASNENPSILA